MTFGPTSGYHDFSATIWAAVEHPRWIGIWTRYPGWVWHWLIPICVCLAGKERPGRFGTQ